LISRPSQVVAAAILSYAVNLMMMSTGLWLSGRSSFRAAVVTNALVLTQFALAFVGLMAQVWGRRRDSSAVHLPLEIGQFYRRYLPCNAFATRSVTVGALRPRIHTRRSFYSRGSVRH
jgi:hypothetical protein